MNYSEFKNQLQKKGSKPHRIAHCLGSRDAWKWVRKNKWKDLQGEPISQSAYSNIITTVNKILVEQLIRGHEIEFPYQMGSLKAVNKEAKLCMDNGKLVDNYRTNWEETFKLWYEDTEAREHRKPVKVIEKRLHSICYRKAKARYSNKRFYMFRANRSLKMAVGAASERGEIISEAMD